MIPYGQLERFGFSNERGGVHLARTMMLTELEQLIEYVNTPDSPRTDYFRVIEEDNCLGKRSGKTRKLTARHLVDLYALEPSAALFRVLRYFWERDPEGRPLLACICAYTRDPILKSSFPFILRMTKGQSYSRESLEEYIEQKQPGRFSKATLTSTAQNVASTWTQAGYLRGRTLKVRAQANATPAVAAYALFVGYLTGARGTALFETEYAKLLDCPFGRIVELAEIASQRGWIVFKRIGKVLEVLFPNLLYQEELELLREQG